MLSLNEIGALEDNSENISLDLFELLHHIGKLSFLCGSSLFLLFEVIYITLYI